jgi:hypothetical protein
MAAEFLNVWITHDRTVLAWEVGEPDPGIFILGSEDTYASEVSEITDLATGWIQLGGGRG